ncbi:MAG: hypothetical protein MUC63_07710, partial [Planctomycetes bacterium]|nr:hypothetical protein [Planctomycetota bacterium]
RISTLYPFFSVETDDRAGRKVTVDAPWPLVRYQHEQTHAGSGIRNWSFMALPFGGAWGKTGDLGAGHFLSAIPPAYAEWSKDEDLAVLPFLYHRRDRVSDRTENVLFPFLWSLQSPRTSTLHLWPLAGWRTARDDAGDLVKWEFSLGWPFLFNAFRDVRRDSTELDFLWPFVHYHEEPGHTRFRILPFAWYERHRDDEQWSALFPLWIQWRDLEREDRFRLDLMWPLFALHRDGAAWHQRLLPLWWYEGDETTDTFVAPFSLYSRRRDDWDLAVLFPLFHAGNYPSAQAWQVDVLWPLFSMKGGGRGAHSHLVPLWWHDADRDEDSSLTLAPALLSWRYTERALSSTGILFPLFKHRRDGLLDETQVDLLWPLFSWRKERGFAHSRLLPLWWHDEGEDESLTIVPPLLAFHRREKDSGFGSVLFPLTWYSWKEGRSSEFRVLWELASYCEEGESWDFRILYKFFHLGKRGKQFEFEMLPFFRFETYEGRLTHFSILGGLFAYDWDVQRRRSETTLFWFLEF